MCVHRLLLNLFNAHSKKNTYAFADNWARHMFNSSSFHAIQWKRTELNRTEKFKKNNDENIQIISRSFWEIFYCSKSCLFVCEQLRTLHVRTHTHTRSIHFELLLPFINGQKKNHLIVTNSSSHLSTARMKSNLVWICIACCCCCSSSSTTSMATAAFRVYVRMWVCIYCRAPTHLNTFT